MTGGQEQHAVTIFFSTYTDIFRDDIDLGLDPDAVGRALVQRLQREPGHISWNLEIDGEPVTFEGKPVRVALRAAYHSPDNLDNHINHEILVKKDCVYPYPEKWEWGHDSRP